MIFFINLFFKFQNKYLHTKKSDTYCLSTFFFNLKITSYILTQRATLFYIANCKHLQLLKNIFFKQLAGQNNTIQLYTHEIHCKMLMLSCDKTFAADWWWIKLVTKPIHNQPEGKRYEKWKIHFNRTYHVCFLAPMTILLNYCHGIANIHCILANSILTIAQSWHQTSWAWRAK